MSKLFDVSKPLHDRCADLLNFVNDCEAGGDKVSLIVSWTRDAIAEGERRGREAERSEILVIADKWIPSSIATAIRARAANEISMLMSDPRYAPIAKEPK